MGVYSPPLAGGEHKGRGESNLIIMILCIGNINFDIIFPISRLPDPHEKMTCEDAMFGFGGSAANTAHWLARLGCNVAMAGTVGDDLPGREHVAALAEAGVNVSGIEISDSSTGIAAIFATGREKRMVRSPGANSHGVFRPELLSGSSMVYLSGGNVSLANEYTEHAEKLGIPVFLNPGDTDPGELLGDVTGVVLNLDELTAITGLLDPDEALLALDMQVAVVTLPEGGCIAVEGFRTKRFPSPEIEPVDRTGGGDAFAAGFLSAMKECKPLEVCAGRGNILAREVIMRWGARPAEINLEDILAKGEKS